MAEHTVLSYTQHLLITAQQRPTASLSTERTDAAWFILLWMFSRGRGGHAVDLHAELRGSHLPERIVERRVVALLEAGHLLHAPSAAGRGEAAYRLAPATESEIQDCLVTELAGLALLLGQSRR